MCTISLIPKSDKGFILTSNRDEAPGRKTFPPQVHEEKGVKLLYPKDAVAGGTWIGISDKRRIVCLMNGGFVPHRRKTSYAKSRGVVVKEFLIAENLTAYIKGCDFAQIEPFTAVIVQWAETLLLRTVVWDGTQIHILPQSMEPRIWSSSPLYPEKLKLKRETWFQGFLNEKENVSPESILHFHKTGGEEDNHSDLVMDRGFVRTKSITQIVKSEESIMMYYEDLETGKIDVSQFEM